MVSTVQTAILQQKRIQLLYEKIKQFNQWVQNNKGLNVVNDGMGIILFSD